MEQVPLLTASKADKGNNSQEKTKDKADSFVNYVLSKKNESGFVAKLKKADNPDTAYQSWEILATWIDITKDYELSPYALIGSALCYCKAQKDGEGNLGEALRRIFMQNNTGGKIENSSEAKRLQRILACSSQEELCKILSSSLRFIVSKYESNAPLNFAQLLREIRYFGFNDENTQKTKLRWAEAFYRNSLAKQSKEE